MSIHILPILILLAVPTAFVYALIRGTKKVKLFTVITFAAAIVLLSIPNCKPLDLTQEDYNPVTGEMQGQQLKTWLDSLQRNNVNVKHWKLRDNSWYRCRTGMSYITELYGSVFENSTEHKTLIQGK